MPGAPSRGTPRESQPNFRDGTVSGLYKGPVGTVPAESVFGENSFYRKTWGTRRGGRHVPNRSSDLVRVVGIFAPLALRAVGIRGKFVLSSPSG